MLEGYISREAAVKYIKSEQCRTCSDIGLCGNCAVLVAVKLLAKVPAADVAEVVHGQWYMLDDCANAGLYCSACGRRVHHEEFAYKKLKSKYCPHCGARMDRGGNGAR